MSKKVQTDRHIFSFNELGKNGVMIEATPTTREDSMGGSITVPAPIAERFHLSLQTPIKIFGATIHTKHGVDYIAALTEEARLTKVADWCRQFWTEDFGPIPNTDQDVVQGYFHEEMMGQHEYTEFHETTL